MERNGILYFQVGALDNVTLGKGFWLIDIQILFIPSGEKSRNGH